MHAEHGYGERISKTAPNTLDDERKAFREGFRITIVGAGIVGLALASFLRRSFFPVTVLEQDEALKEIGAGIELGVNACRVLQQLHLLDKVKANAVRTTRLVLHSYEDGRFLSVLNVVPHIESRYGLPCLSIHRADLRLVLFEEAQALGAEILFGRKVDASKSNFDAGIVEGSGFRIDADLIIAAEGQHSPLRDFLLQKQTPPVFTGKAVTRVLIDVATLVEADHADIVDDFHAWLGPESMAVGYKLRNAFNVALAHTSEEKPAFLGPQVVEQAYVKDLVRNWEPNLRAIVDLADQFQEWPLLAPSESPRSWKSANGKLALIGDAAHACLPYLAQGAAMGLESACCLSRLLSKASEKAQILHALQLYERIRRPRTDQVIQATLDTGSKWMMPDGSQKVERDRRLISEEPPRSGFPNPYLDPVFQPWLWEYDAILSADEAWRQEFP